MSVPWYSLVKRQTKTWHFFYLIFNVWTYTSDHIALLRAYEGWQIAKREKRDRQYCWENYLSPPVLNMMEEMRFQFLDLLSDTGFYDRSKGLQVNIALEGLTFYMIPTNHSHLMGKWQNRFLITSSFHCYQNTASNLLAYESSLCYSGYSSEGLWKLRGVLDLGYTQQMWGILVLFPSYILKSSDLFILFLWLLNPRYTIAILQTWRWFAQFSVLVYFQALSIWC